MEFPIFFSFQNCFLKNEIFHDIMFLLEGGGSFD